MRKPCGKLTAHDGHWWWGHEVFGPKTTYWCTGKKRVMEGGHFGLRPRGTLAVDPPPDPR
jgi:hypothetical protein